MANPDFSMPRKCAPREKCGDLIVRWMRIDAVRILAATDINDRQVRLDAAWPNIPKH
ncbi:hypothetical protein [Bradyrhizobium sp. AUGA SZCCT0431]|uniref:hypothetical protein n=1 Tax=Bradyrhizobium sp. AUGA SZCCT0431 TaxID=2807674 RepID=UPI001BAAF019|nr:hypothetical protein [Bradyrhizobium sp. AUGA SZCCT0431]MBR1143697.1 hypothetical protein [Bradyrhizobium sp. AUGA SZCCT0431]